MPTTRVKRGILRHRKLLCDVGKLGALSVIKSLSFIGVIFLAASNTSGADLKNCTSGDYEYAESWGGRYDPEQAFNFGSNLQEIVRGKNSEKLYELVDRDLRNGPRRGFALSNDFDSIFPKKWQKEVLEKSPPCSPIGYRGFMLGNGAIWYAPSESGFKITSLNGVTSEAIAGGLWEINSTPVPPRCLTFPSLSGDDFEEIADRHGISNSEDFHFEPGKFLGNRITDFEEFEPSWCRPDCDGEVISFGKQLQACSSIATELTVSKEKISEPSEDEFGEPCNLTYTVINTLPASGCQAMAGDFEQECLSARLLEIRSTCTLGTMPNVTVGAYGAFHHESDDIIILPLRFFSSANSARDYADTLSGTEK